jgi:acylpyruvate hydrolase
MRLVAFEGEAGPRLGALVDDRVIDLHAVDPTIPSDVVAFLEAGDTALAAARSAATNGNAAGVPLDTVTLLPPVPRPPKIICVARNYGAHAKEAGRELSEIPILFARFASTLVAHGAPVLRPTLSDELDWEGELAVVIGRPGRHVRIEDAMDYVAGYSIFNDVTLRDYQFRTSQYTEGKNFAASGPFGPVLALKDEGIDPHDVEIVTDVNGEEMQRANTADMVFDIPTIVNQISDFVGLEAGDVIAMGTPSGVGFTRKPPRFLVPGDVVRVTIGGLGTLENPIVAEEAAP